MSTIPIDVINAMIVLTNKIQNDIETIASNNELEDNLSPHYSLKHANNIIALTLQKAIEQHNDILFAYKE